MKRSVQEIVELLVFGLIALLIGTGLLWLAGWVFDLVGVLFKFFAALIWSLLRFIVPVAVGAAIVYALVRLIQQQREKSAASRSAAANDATSAPAEGSSTSAAVTPPPPPPVHDPGADGESHPTASEVWVPPQPSPPTSSSETLEEPRPPEDSGPVGEINRDASPLDPVSGEHDATGSVPSVDDEITRSVPQADHDATSWTPHSHDEATGSVTEPEDEQIGSVPLAHDGDETDHIGNNRANGSDSDEYDEDERRS